MPASLEQQLQQRLTRIGAKLARARAAAEAAATAETIPAPQQLRQRARELARPQRLAESAERLAVIEFELEGQLFACETSWVEEVFRPRELTPLPGAPAPVVGLVNRRGTILSVADLRPLLALSTTAEEALEVVLVLAGEGSLFGFMAARVDVARELFRSDLAPSPATWPEPALRYLQGVLPGAVPLLDARRLLTAPWLQVEPTLSTTP
ncbi:MAG: chemotaxis protein CheW [Desulfuromonadales bacterium]|nr:chemotaxis protein CheW [Desulfuromonadales bacterium]